MKKSLKWPKVQNRTKNKKESHRLTPGTGLPMTYHPKYLLNELHKRKKYQENTQENNEKALEMM